MTGPPEPPRTGHPAVDASLQALAEAAHAAPAEQVPAYQAVHRTLRETLASIDEAADGGRVPGAPQPQP